MVKPKTKLDIEKIAISIDMGGSKTKAVVQRYPEGEEEVILIDSDLADVSKESLESLQAEGVPESRAWVGVLGEYYVLGMLARERFGGIAQLRELKYELAVPKICGTIWAAKEKLSLANDIAAYCAVLLPPGEVQDKGILETKLKEAFRSFETPSGKMRVKLLTFAAFAEGNGVLLHRKRTLGNAKYNSKNLALVMIGYRNSSAFISKGGNLSRGVTSDFGMSWMVNSFVGRASGLSVDNPNVVEVLVKAGASCNACTLQQLSRKRKREEIATDGEAMAKAAKVARDEYARALCRWIRSVMPQDVDEIIFCGGTAEYIKPELDAYFVKLGISVVWHGGVEVPVHVADTMGSRMVDVWALHKSFVENIDKATGHVRDTSAPKQDAVAEETGEQSTAWKQWKPEPKKVDKIVIDYTPQERPKEFLAMDDNI
jgi:hypothetical protein